MEMIKYECPKRCHLYSKSFEEIIEAGNKHREKVLALKDISENQKIKISSLREERNQLLDTVDRLELDQKRDSDMILRMTSETRNLKREVRDQKNILLEKEEILIEKMEKENVMEVLELKSKDLEDELITKDIYISNLEELVKKKESNETHLESELSSSDTNRENLVDKVRSLEATLKRIKEIEIYGKKKRVKLFEKMDTIVQERQGEVEKLKEKIKGMKQKPLPKCWHGKYCSRWLCNFDHRHIYTKVNIHLQKLTDNQVQEYLCDECGKVFESYENLQTHIASCHKDIPSDDQNVSDDVECELRGNARKIGEEKQHQNENCHIETLTSFKCKECPFVSDSRSNLNSHVIRSHNDDEI